MPHTLTASFNTMKNKKHRLLVKENKKLIPISDSLLVLCDDPPSLFQRYVTKNDITPLLKINMRKVYVMSNGKHHES